MGVVRKPSQRHRVQKVWGYEDWIWNQEYCGKTIFMTRRHCCSWHYHELKDEVLYLQSGSVLLRHSLGDDIEAALSVKLEPGDSFHVPRSMRHTMLALEDSFIFEFSTHHEDSDSIRLIPGY